MYVNSFFILTIYYFACKIHLLTSKENNMQQNISLILTEEAYNILGEIQENIAQKEMLKKCTQAMAITRALIALKDKINSEDEIV